MKKIYEQDPWLMPYKDAIDARHEHIWQTLKHIAGDGLLKDAVNNHLYYGLHQCKDGSWVFREFAPNASRIFLIGDCNNWKRTEAYSLKPLGQGNWELRLPEMFLRHGELYKLYMEWPGGGGERIPSYATRVVQDPVSKVFSAQVWDPVKPYVWKHGHAGRRPHPFIY
jgi:1,4-alpha-glucan branching enzyme